MARDSLLAMSLAIFDFTRTCLPSSLSVTRWDCYIIMIGEGALLNPIFASIFIVKLNRTVEFSVKMAIFEFSPIMKQHDLDSETLKLASNSKASTGQWGRFESLIGGWSPVPRRLIIPAILEICWIHGIILGTPSLLS